MCDSNALCTNTEGSYVCACKVGYTGDGKTCTGTNGLLCVTMFSIVSVTSFKEGRHRFAL